MDFRLRRDRLGARLPELDIDALLVTRLPNVRYLSGFTGSNAQLLLARDQDASVFLTDGRYTEQSSREVPDLRRETYSGGSFRDAFAAVCTGAGVRRVGFEAAGVSYALFQQLSSADGLELVPVAEEVERLRWTKDREEIELIGRAQTITDEAFERITAKLAESVTERELALELEFTMRQAGADGLAFDSIVAFGESAAEPHHHPSDRPLRQGDIVKLDFGAMAAGYHSDMTRTVSFGEPPAELREIHDLVSRAQQAGIDAVRAGVTGGDADAAARDVIAGAGHAEHFGHSLGHGVGLEIHEGPSLRANARDVLPVGAVVTVEPGVYVGGLGGVRIEDMVEVTEDGCRVIGTSTRELVVL
ncbi:MAG: M24 family metallopeptidase [Actinomycetota bacterium]